MITPLDHDAVAAALESLDGWEIVDGRLVRDVECPSPGAEALVGLVATAADTLDHHPIVDVCGDRVRFTVWTHSLDALTSRDLDLAARIDEIVRDTVTR
jgi:4a-hydroxytetrahydrobiopterin dehydratase